MQVRKRKALGAFYTPANLAQYLAGWAVISPTATVLEPSIGRGALVEAVLENLDAAAGGRVIGYEIDEDTCRAAQAKFSDSPVTIHNADFLNLPPESIKPVDAIVANPPFTRNHQLPRHIRNELKGRSDFANVVTGAPGIWVYFVLASFSYLKLGGRLASIAPGAIAFTDYSASLLEILRQRFRTVTLVAVDGPVEWEGAAQERPAIILAEGFGLGPASEVRRHTISLSATQTVSAAVTPHKPVQSQILGDLARLEIGVVTGANRSFVISETQARERDLPRVALLPIVSRARHVRGLSVTSHEMRMLAQEGERTLLLLPETLGPRGGAIRRYLATVSKEQRRGTLWFSKRDPWWRVQLGRTCDAIFTYMNNSGPRLAIVDPGLVCTNTLHRVAFINRDPTHALTICASMLTTFTQLEAERLGRVYGGGVLKFELKDARRLPLLIPPTSIERQSFERLDYIMRTEGQDAATLFADGIILPHFFGADWIRVQTDLRKQLSILRARRGIADKNSD
ncbi:N-6 DNA methylase [Mesorhizobium sp. B283B1A]|uniref:N-6 DNA methylase n=1 Tax=Mesorhizobium TaxID=68287 RepID=UPI001CD134B3|nr:MULTISPECIES: N-6 DNA methylase [Mesorhizobium]MCA0049515.1 N-6 DNA methylase [Mesorhizobium sp. B283B1A]UQS63756.1 N-6 DNA methylase [Mesorhizobium opportunistum]